MIISVNPAGYYPVSMPDNRKLAGLVRGDVFGKAVQVFVTVEGSSGFEWRIKDGGGPTYVELIAALYAATFPREEWEHEYAMALQAVGVSDA